MYPRFTQVCKHALVSFCPHELFPNTRFEMGHCEKRHDEFFKKQFFLLTDDERLPYELKYIDETIGRLFTNLQLPSKNKSA